MAHQVILTEFLQPLYEHRTNHTNTRLHTTSEAVVRVCAYIVLQTVIMSGACRAVNGTVHYIETLKFPSHASATLNLLNLFCVSCFVS